MCGTAVRLAHDEASDRELHLLELAGAAEMPETLALPSPHFTCLVAADALRLSDADVHRLAARLLAAGAVHLVAWGPGARRLARLFDDAVLMAETSQAEETLVLASGHEGDLEDALGFLLWEVTPSSAYLEACRSALVVTVGLPEAARCADRALADPAAFRVRMAGYVRAAANLLDSVA